MCITNNVKKFEPILNLFFVFCGIFFIFSAHASHGGHKYYGNYQRPIEVRAIRSGADLRFRNKQAQWEHIKTRSSLHTTHLDASNSHIQAWDNTPWPRQEACARSPKPSTSEKTWASPACGTSRLHSTRSKLAAALYALSLLAPVCAAQIAGQSQCASQIAGQIVARGVSADLASNVTSPLTQACACMNSFGLSNIWYSRACAMPQATAQPTFVEKSRYKNAIFDMGGVLIDFNPRATARTLFGNDPELVEKLSTIHHLAEWRELDRGELPINTVFQNLARQLNVSVPVIEKFSKAAFVSCGKLLIDGISLMCELKAQGYNIYYLSNMAQETYKSVVLKKGFMNVAAGGVFSFQTKTVKPLPAIYHTLLERYHLKPEESVFIDDIEANIAGGRAVGIDGIAHKNYLESRSHLRANADDILDAVSCEGNDECKRVHEQVIGNAWPSQAYTPWREAWQQKALSIAQTACPFCSQLAMPSDSDNFILNRTENFAVLLNKYPYGKGHILIVPLAHIKDFNGLTDHAKTELMRISTDIMNILKAKLKPDGFNLGANIGKCAGASIPDHLHIHIVPRYEKEGLAFIHTIAQTNVISWDLKKLYELLEAAFKEHKKS